MNRGICYLLIGDRHPAVMAVSLMTLRNFWTGPITIYAGDEPAKPYAKMLAEASGASYHEFACRNQKRHKGYVSKPLIPKLSPYDQTLQIDGDTVITGYLDEEIWPQTSGEVVLTKFGDWTTHGNIIHNRLKKWLEVAPQHAKTAMETCYPALNTGVLSYCKESKLTSVDWLEMVMRKPMEFISDEIAMQLLYPYAENVRLASHKYNCSPMYGKREDIRLWHFHGKKHLRAESIDLWWPCYQEALDCNYAHIREWTPAGDDRLQDYLAKQNKYPVQVD